MARETSALLKWSLTVYSIISAVIGIGFIVWACVIQNPPAVALPIGLIILGSISLALTIWGAFQAWCARTCINLYLLLCAVGGLINLIIMILLLVAFNHAVETLATYSVNQYQTAQSDATSQAYNDLNVPRYIFFVLTLFQMAAIVTTIIIRIRKPYETSDEEIDERRSAQSAAAQIQMESLKNSVRGNSKSAASPTPDSNFYTASNKMYRSVTRKMTSKYGEFTQDPAFQRRWWHSIPGFR